MSFLIPTTDYSDSKEQKVEIGSNASALFTPTLKPIIDNKETFIATKRIQLSERRHVVAQRWNNQTYICIREYYQKEDRGKYIPGKKGINLTVSQWYQMLHKAGEVEDMLSEINYENESVTSSYENDKRKRTGESIGDENTDVCGSVSEENDNEKTNTVPYSDVLVGLDTDPSNQGYWFYHPK